MYQQIKDKHSVITWSAARRFLSFQRQHPSDREHSQQGVPAKSQILCWKTRLTLQLRLVPTKALLFIYLSRDSSQCTILMNPSCSRASQLGTSYLARDHSHAKCFAGQVMCAGWLIIIFLYICIQLLAFFTLLLFIKAVIQKNIKKLFGKIFSIHGVSGVTVSEM